MSASPNLVHPFGTTMNPICMRKDSGECRVQDLDSSTSDLATVSPPRGDRESLTALHNPRTEQNFLTQHRFSQYQFPESASTR